MRDRSTSPTRTPRWSKRSSALRRSAELELIRAHPDLGARAAALGEADGRVRREQARAGLGQRSSSSARPARARDVSYRDKFGFPFVVCVREHRPESIIARRSSALDSTLEEERRTALREIAQIAALRLEGEPGERDDALAGVDYSIAYGKAEVPVYRHDATPLGLADAPESPLTGRDNALFAHEVTVEVHGDNFLPAYTAGDNSDVVATDSMKNFILRQAREYEGATLEGYLAQLGTGYLDRYEQMQEVRSAGASWRSAWPRRPATTASSRGRCAGAQWGDYSVAERRYARKAGGAVLTELRSGRVNMELLKLKGSAFTRFVRDEYTTLPERSDRPLFIGLDVHWVYSDPRDAIGADHTRYVAGEQVRDVCAAVFHEFVSESIQQLVHEMGKRLLERYRQLRSLDFVAKNMTRDPYADPDDPAGERKLFVPPFPAFGTIALSMTRST